jgi:predicted nucleic acid-binding protein
MGIVIDQSKIILLDADVIIHFIKGDRLAILTDIFPNKYGILDFVFNEVFKGNLRTQVENLLIYKRITEVPFDDSLEVTKEFASLKKRYGLGESACMAYCKFHKEVFASSNLADIKPYCEANGIQYITTMDLLAEAFKKGMLTEKECDNFITLVKSKNSKLPVNSIQEFLRRYP